MLLSTTTEIEVLKEELANLKAQVVEFLPDVPYLIVVRRGQLPQAYLAKLGESLRACGVSCHLLLVDDPEMLRVYKLGEGERVARVEAPDQEP